MVREEAKDTLFAFMPKGMTIQNVLFETAIDEIYDDIERQRLMSYSKGYEQGKFDIQADMCQRTCDNCGLYGEFEYEIPGAEDFTNTTEGCTLFRIFFKKSHSCNEWESK